MPGKAKLMNTWRLIAHREHAKEVVQWSRSKGVVAIGWGGTGDLRKRRFRIEEELTQLVADSHPDSRNYVDGGRSLWRFYNEMGEGDLVIISTGRLRTLTMRVASDYSFVDGEYPPYYAHRRGAEALPVDPNRLWQLSGGPAQGENIRRTLIRCAHVFSDAEFNRLVA